MIAGRGRGAVALDIQGVDLAAWIWRRGFGGVDCLAVPADDRCGGGVVAHAPAPAGMPHGVKRVAKKGGSLWGESEPLNPALVRFFYLGIFL